MSRRGVLRLTAVALSCVACASSPPPARPAAEEAAPAPPAGSSVWAVDLVRTRPGGQEEYLRSIAANWAGARRLAHERRLVRSYRALVASPDSSRGWDVILLTEYPSAEAFAAREATFREIFASPRYLAGRVSGGRAPGELREFVASGVEMRVVAESVP